MKRQTPMKTILPVVLRTRVVIKVIHNRTRDGHSKYGSAGGGCVFAKLTINLFPSIFKLISSVLSIDKKQEKFIL